MELAENENEEIRAAAIDSFLKISLKDNDFWIRYYAILNIGDIEDNNYDSN